MRGRWLMRRFRNRRLLSGFSACLWWRMLNPWSTCWWLNVFWTIVDSHRRTSNRGHHRNLISRWRIRGSVVGGTCTVVVYRHATTLVVMACEGRLIGPPRTRLRKGWREWDRVSGEWREGMLEDILPHILPHRALLLLV